MSGYLDGINPGYFLTISKTTIQVFNISNSNTLRNTYRFVILIINVANFLFQPDPIDGVKFKPIKIDIHQGIIKIVDKEIHYDFELNNTESVIVGTDRKEVLARIQTGFERQYILYGKLKREDIRAVDYETLQAWKRIQKHIINK